MAARLGKAAMLPHDSTSFIENNKPILDDVDYKKMKANFAPSGKGRPPTIQPGPLTNKLVLQLELLRTETNASWKELVSFLPDVLDGDPLQGFSFKNEVKAALKQGKKAKDQGTEKFDDFLSIDLGMCIMMKNVGPHLQKHNIFRQHLLKQDVLKQLTCPSEVENGMIVDLILFHTKEHRHLSNCRATLQFFGVDVTDLSNEQISLRLKKIYTTYQVHCRNRTKRPNGQEKMNVFMSARPDFSCLGRTAPKHATGAALDALNTPESIRLHVSENRLSRARRDIEELDLMVSREIDNNAVLQDLLRSSSGEVQKLQEQISAGCQELVIKQTENQQLNRRLRQTGLTIQTLKRNNKHTRLQKKEKQLQLKEAVVAAHEGGHCEKTIKRLRRQKKLLQTKVSNAKREMQRVKESSVWKIRQLQQALDELTSNPKDIPVVKLKDSNGHFKAEAKVCVMALTGECEVPASRCGTIIRTVLQQLIGAVIPEGDLPSQRTALRFCDQAHVLSKAHVAETLQDAEYWDLHSDGTSRSGQKYVCQAVTTQDATMSVGFTPVTTEDTATLVEISIQMLEELSMLHGDGEVAQENFVRMLAGLSGVMSDRAAVMKSFARSLQDERRVLLQTEEGLDFLHCNAHFLLGLSTEAKKVLAEKDKAREERPAGFWKPSECLAYRYIRMACDCLGPRGDDKSGVRDSWLAYCLMEAKTSTMTSFRENRFNNTFQGAANLHFHREDIQDCLVNYLTHQNKKIAVVLADCQSEETDSHVIALGLLYFRLTGPYWSLLGSQVHYLDFHVHVVRMHTALRQWQGDATPLLCPDCPAVFPGISFQHNPHVLKSLLDIGDPKKDDVKCVLEKVCAAMVTVTERQLADFLPNGRYHAVQDEDLRHKLSHSHITNLVAEEIFADLDFSLFKRRSCSLFHHSTVNMMKRNKPISSWYMGKSRREQRDLLKMSATKSAALRQKHVVAEKDAIRKRRKILQENRQNKQASDDKHQRKIASVMGDLKRHNGPCSSPADVDQLLTAYHTNISLKTALRAELFFQKLVLLKRSPLLLVNGTSLNLFNRLQELFGGQPREQLPLRKKPAAHRTYMHPRRKLDFESDAETEDEDSSLEAAPTFLFEKELKFTREGDVVAVYFTEDFYIGEVTKLIGEEEAEMNFMERSDARTGMCVYKWPHPADCCHISASVVFAKDIALAPSSSSGRAFVVDTPVNLSGRYEAFKLHLRD